MTEINFYVSKEEGLEHRLSIAYRLIQRALQRNLHIHVHTDSELTSAQLDDYLWCKETTSFIPHGIISSESTDQTSGSAETGIDDSSQVRQINISHDYEPMATCDYLINLSNQRPAFISRFL